MKILVTGGAGYIGSHTVKELQNQKHEVTVFDNLIYGHKQAVNCPLVKGDLLNKESIKAVFKKYQFDAVIHFAAYAQAGESMTDPAKYFENNIQGGLNLLESMRESGVKNLVFSSTCAIYGYPDKLPVGEDESKKPVSVYGESKLSFEKILAWYDQIFGIKNVCLRYFNACGDSLDSSIGEDHRPETHIIPVAMEVALGKREKFQIFGDDYPTTDGTNIRDYIHVLDLASAHILALKYLIKKKKSNFFNVGTGQGYSNKQILDMVKKVTQKDFPVLIAPRRPGDPAQIFADNRKIKKELGWSPQFSDLETIVKSAWDWHRLHPKGYLD
jgi:UDP-glucose 4-epimerase